MEENDIFLSESRSSGDMAGVYEHDGESGFFYLYQITGAQRILDAIRIVSGPAGFKERNISIRWNSEETKVGLFIFGVLWAAFDLASKTKQGGDYTESGKPSISQSIQESFSRMLN